jgi:hypothetical protein
MQPHRIVPIFTHRSSLNTARSGIETYGPVAEEEPSDLLRPEKTSDLSYWLVPDTLGSLKGMLDVLRRSEYCRDVLVLISERTPEDYVQYLEPRNYPFIRIGVTLWTIVPLSSSSEPGMTLEESLWMRALLSATSCSNKDW